MDESNPLSKDECLIPNIEEASKLPILRIFWKPDLKIDIYINIFYKNKFLFSPILS